MSVQYVGALTQRKLPQRVLPIQSIIFHTTGDTDLAKILRYYRAPDGLQPHVVIDLDGVARRIAWETQVAYHCKIEPAEARLYRLGYDEWSKWVWRNNQPEHVGEPFAGYAQWRAQWPQLRSPLDLVTADHPNSCSLGIELQQPEKPGPDIFTDAQYTTARAVIEDWHERFGVPLERRTVLGHYDCSPMRRSTAAGGWDPGVKFNWQRILQTA